MQEATDILGPDGPIARALGGDFESRHEQGRMAQGVAQAMEDRSHLVVEAGTGVGKSFAYLVPAILRCLRKGERVVVATNTISLQEQLVEKDIPLLRRVLGEEATEGLTIEGRSPTLRVALVKGRGNYLSVRRLKLASQRQDKILADRAARESLHAIEDWAYATTDGTLSTLPPLARMGVWDKVQSDSGNCMGRRCPTYEQCFYQRARREMEQANLLICNHALFFSDLALRGQEAGFLPAYDHVILDEAHNVEDVASEHFGLSLAEGRVVHLLNTLYQSRSGKGYLAQLGLLSGDAGSVERAIALVEQAHDASRAFFEEVGDLVSRPREESAWHRPEAGSVRINDEGAVTNVLTPVMRELSLRLKGLKEAAKVDADRYELNAFAIRAEMIAQEAQTLVSRGLGGYVYWAEVGGEESAFRGSRKVTLACSPIEVAPLLKERLFSKEFSVVLTSATLSTRRVSAGESTESSETAFAHTLARLGCEGARTLQLGSPFDFASQMEFYIDPCDVDGPQGQGRGGGRGYAQALSERILKHVKATQGGAFVLFTSFASLNAVAAELAGPLAALGMPLLAQGRDGSRAQILARFRENESSVLLGASSFWQGVDVRGRGLRNVIITKLPFDPPDRPITQARHELMESRGQNPFNEDSLPRAIIRFKQGLGRLIRSKSDRGRVVVLDGRLLTARYAKRFLAALPDGVEIIREA